MHDSQSVDFGPIRAGLAEPVVKATLLPHRESVLLALFSKSCHVTCVPDGLSAGKTYGCRM
jgi:hypothetical protein